MYAILMISRMHRFHGYNSLNFVYKNGSTTRGPLFAIKCVLNPRRKTYRVAVVVSKKVHKSAVARNRMRRRLYAAMQEFGPQINAPYDIVLTVFQESLLEEPPKSLVRQLKRQLEAAGILDKA
jgi:ribonuclease P protein component